MTVDDDIRIEWHTADRARLRWLFELAEDSPVQLDSYLHAGRLLVAVRGTEVVGHLLLVDTGAPAPELEIKNMAVRTADQGRGIGARLVRAALDAAAAGSCRRVLVATAAADTGNLHFYQRRGFRMLRVERDVFTPAAGYPPGLRIDGIDLRDRVWLDQSVRPRTRP